ncbi:hypothetical protein [Kineosporia sp. NBRC 101677]|uniref:hypothetical protein n=1 Tax=Kineosporia sp. NBRC 101677 TaxID=3032197 RepID=UPI002555D802|nr:hypothetical protein [Kineosporia sp. NBRC 101677]
MRRVQMSTDELFVIVEGRDHDVPFYEGIIESMGEPKRGFQIWLREQIALPNSQAGGKPAAIELFRLLKQQGRLKVTGSGNIKSIIFMLDDDGDFVANKRLRSPHVIYTCHADVESELFGHGNIAEAVRIACSLSKAEAAALPRDVTDALNSLSARWEEWIKISQSSHLLGIRTGFKPSDPSPINGDKYGQLDPNASRAAEQLLRSKCQTGEELKLKRMEARINNLSSRGELGRLVKGKLVSGFLLYELKMRFANDPISTKSVKSGLSAILLTTLDFSADWAGYYRDQIRLVVAT